MVLASPGGRSRVVCSLMDVDTLLGASISDYVRVKAALAPCRSLV